MTKTTQSEAKIWKNFYFFVSLHTEQKQLSTNISQDYGKIHQTRDAEHERQKRAPSLLSTEDQPKHQFQRIC